MTNRAPERSPTTRNALDAESTQVIVHRQGGVLSITALGVWRIDIHVRANRVLERWLDQTSEAAPFLALPSDKVLRRRAAEWACNPRAAESTTDSSSNVSESGRNATRRLPCGENIATFESVDWLTPWLRAVGESHCLRQLLGRIRRALLAWTIFDTQALKRSQVRRIDAPGFAFLRIVHEAEAVLSTVDADDRAAGLRCGIDLARDVIEVVLRHLADYRRVQRETPRFVLPLLAHDISGIARMHTEPMRHLKLACRQHGLSQSEWRHLVQPDASLIVRHCLSLQSILSRESAGHVHRAAIISFAVERSGWPFKNVARFAIGNLAALTPAPICRTILAPFLRELWHQGASGARALHWNPSQGLGFQFLLVSMAIAHKGSGWIGKRPSWNMLVATVWRRFARRHYQITEPTAFGEVRITPLNTFAQLRRCGRQMRNCLGNPQQWTEVLMGKLLFHLGTRSLPGSHAVMRIACTEGEGDSSWYMEAMMGSCNAEPSEIAIGAGQWLIEKLDRAFGRVPQPLIVKGSSACQVRPYDSLLTRT
jgi:hypothetical protein